MVTAIVGGTYIAVIAIPATGELVEGNTYRVTFNAQYFSTYAVGYQAVENPSPVYEPYDYEGYKFVKTGVEGNAVTETVSYGSYITLVCGLALVAVELRRRLAD